MACEDLTGEELTQQMEGLKLSRPQHKAAADALRRASMEATEENKRLWLVLRQYKGRVHPEQLDKAKAKIDQVKGTYMVKRVLCYKKSLYPELDKQLDIKWFIDPMSMKDFPEDLEREECWCIDSGYKGEIGPGGVEIVSKVGKETRIRQQAPSRGGLALTDGEPTVAQASEATPLVQGVSKEQGQQEHSPGVQSTSQGLLRSRPEEDEGNSAQSLEDIAQSAKEAADAGRFVNGDALQNDTLESWCDVFLACLKAHRTDNKDETTIPPHMKMFIDFVVEDVLLVNDCYDDLPVFSGFLLATEELYADSLSKLARATLELAKGDGASLVGIDIGGLKGRKAHLFKTCKLFTGFLRRRYVKKLESLQGELQATDCPGRQQELKFVDDAFSLLQAAGPKAPSNVALGAEACKELLVMKCLLEHSCVQLRLQYMLNAPTTFQVLEKWCPKHTLHKWRLAASADVRWKEQETDSTMELVRGLAKLEHVVPKIVNVPLKTVVVEYMKGQAAFKDGVQEGVVGESSSLARLVARLFQEAVQSRLGCQTSLTASAPVSEPLDILRPCPRLVKTLHKVYGSLARKMASCKGSGGTVLVALHKANEELTIESSVEVPEVKADTGSAEGKDQAANMAGGSSEATGPGAQAEVKPQKKTAETDKEPQGELQNAAATFSVGDRVRIDMKRKAEFNGKLGTVTKVAKHGSKVQLDGWTECRAFAAHNMEKVTEEPKPAASKAEVTKVEAMAKIFGKKPAQSSDSEDI